jgi:hypothetical protein
VAAAKVAASALVDVAKAAVVAWLVAEIDAVLVVRAAVVEAAAAAAVLVTAVVDATVVVEVSGDGQGQLPKLVPAALLLMVVPSGQVP